MYRQIRSRWWLGVAVAAGYCAGAWGQTPSQAATAPPPAARSCSACHGAEGQGINGNPRIASHPAPYLRAQLEQFKSGARRDPTMQAVAGTLSSADINVLAAWFSQLQPAFTPARISLSAAAQARGRELVTVGDWPRGVPACARCHGPELRGVAPDIPALIGHPAGYLEKRLRTFQVRRGNQPLIVMMRRVSSGLSAADLQAVSAYIAQLKPDEVLQTQRPRHAAYRFTAQSAEHFSPPPESAIPAGPDGEMIWKGRQIFEDTQTRAAAYVGNALNCSNCHLDRGRLAGSSPMWAAYVSYPKYRSKNHRVNTLIERIQDCFRFSMNGTAPPADSETLVALVHYFHWLATGLPVGMVPKGAGYPALRKPAQPYSIERGANIYASHCAMCHAGEGEGRKSGNVQIFPPLWGPQSYNWGAGMERISTAAAFIEANMPYGAGGSLTNQQAWDVAAFVNSHSRPQDPRFTGKVQTTRERYHTEDSYYGRVVNGRLLGAPAAHTQHEQAGAAGR